MAANCKTAAQSAQDFSVKHPIPFQYNDILKMLDFIGDYFRALFRYWWVMMFGLLGGANNVWKWFHPDRKDISIPHWVRIGVAVGAVVLAQFLAYRDSIKNLNAVISEKQRLSSENWHFRNDPRPSCPAPQPCKAQVSHKDLDIVCQRLEDCPSHEVRKRALQFAKKLDDFYLDFDKKVNEPTDEAHKPAHDAIVRGLTASMSSKYRSDYEAAVLTYRRVIIDRLPAGSADHSHDYLYDNPGAAWRAFGLIYEVHNIADDLRQLASQLPEH